MHEFLFKFKTFNLNATVINQGEMLYNLASNSDPLTAKIILNDSQSNEINRYIKMQCLYN